MTTAVVHTTHLVVGGAAIAREDSGRVVFVSGALPGETVRVTLRTAKKDFASADVTEVLAPSADRVTPPCEAWHRGCGGCDWQHIAPAAQLGAKVAIVTEALTRTARLTDPQVQAGGTVAAWGYRTTVRLAVDNGGVGFRSRRSHHVVPITHCPISSDAVNEEIAALHDVDAGEVTVRASVATGERNLSLHGPQHGVGELTPSVLTEVVAGVPLRVSIGSFFQSSPHAAELLVAAVGRASADIDLPMARVVDAYGGIGLFACTVAAEAAEVIVVEGSSSACADARANLRGRHSSVVERRVEDWEPVAADLVIADPARSGLDKQAAAVLAATEAPVLVLVSCDTGSLARDTRLLADHGYVHDGTEVIDAFPNTSHIETVTRFVRVTAS